MYVADETRYDGMIYNRCGESGLKLPAVSLGLWHNFGSEASFGNMVDMCRTAFDRGITHFDLANDYGPVAGAAEENFGRLVASLDRSLIRMGLEYVDIFYHHRPDPDTPLEETACALDGIVRSGKALYIGVSNYNKEQTVAIAAIFKKLHTPFIIQRRYSMFDRTIERDGLKDYAAKNGIGIITFCPLEQGILTGRYLNGIPADSRIRTDGRFLHEDAVTEERLKKVRALEEIARERNQTIAQMALAWILRDGDVTSVLIGASKPSQISENIGMLSNPNFSEEDRKRIDEILA